MGFLKTVKSVFGDKQEDGNDKCNERVPDTKTDGKVDEEALKDMAEGKAAKADNAAEAGNDVKANASKAETSKAETEGHVATTMLINKSVMLGEGEIDLDGIVRGKFQTGEDVWIVAPGFVVGGKISGLETLKSISVHEIENAPAHVFVKSTGIKGRVDHAVLTNIPPQEKADVNVAVENPLLTGLMCEFAELNKSQEYVNLLFFAAVHSNYIIPVTFSKELKRGEDGKVTIPEGTQINFQVLKTDNGPVVGIYTDYRALSAALKTTDHEGRKPDTWVMRFQDAVGINQQVKGLGIAINPFGPQPPLNLSNDHIQSIITSDGYRQEFGDKQSPLQ